MVLISDILSRVLVVVDTLSRYIFAEPIKNKSAPSVLQAFMKIMKDNGRFPAELISDSGKYQIILFKFFLFDTVISISGREYVNQSFSSMLKEYGIQHHLATSRNHAALAENAVKLIKHRLY